MIIWPTLLNALKLEPVEFQFKYVGIALTLHVENIRNGIHAKNNRYMILLD